MNKDETTKKILELESQLEKDIRNEEREMIQDNLHELRKKLDKIDS